ncbi:MAG TPA: hypothetical protein VNO52_03895 [Methylomirabilota bacterium]|nr:hypothetical protein [Methylomirabilota bacterium]
MGPLPDLFRVPRTNGVLQGLNEAVLLSEETVDYLFQDLGIADLSQALFEVHR